MEVIHNATYKATPVGKSAVGVCQSGSSGNPFRNCTLSGNQGVWSVTYSGMRCMGEDLLHLFLCIFFIHFLSFLQLEYCPEATIDDALYVATPAGQARQGLCLAGYEGFPVLRCLVEGFDIGVWDNNVEGTPCIGKELASYHLKRGREKQDLVRLVIQDGSVHSGIIAAGILGTIGGLFLLAMIVLFIVKRKSLIRGTGESFFPLEEIRNNLGNKDQD